MKEYFEAQCAQIAANFENLKALGGAVAEAGELCVAALKAGGKVMFCGNGGSAADAQHLAAELSGRFEANRPGIAGLALTTDTSALTAIANDFGYECVFSRQVEAIGRAGDVLYAISTSGNSANVLAAIETARARDIRVIAVTGASGGRMREMCDVLLNVPAEKAARVQEMHIALGHVLCGMIERALYA